MKLLAIVVCLGLLAVATPCLAEDGNNVFDQLGDAMSGKGNTYIGAEVIKDITLKSPVLGVDKIGLKVWADVMAGELDDDINRDVRGGLRLRLVL